MSESPMTCGKMPAPAAAWAEGPRYVKRDAACTPVAVVQFLDCTVDVAYRCPSVPGLGGTVWREESFDANGLASVDVSTSDGVMIESLEADGSYYLEGDPKHFTITPLSKVIATGKGRFSSRLSIVMGGKKAPVTMSLSVASQGKTVALGPEKAQLFQGKQVTDYPQPIGHVETTFLIYVLPDLGLVISGEKTAGTLFHSDEAPHRPMGLSLPATEEDVTTTPAFCGQKLS